MREDTRIIIEICNTYNNPNFAGSSILLPVLALVFLVGAIRSSPYDEFRSSIVEFYDTNLDEPKYRLKDNVKPLRQTVDLDVYLDEDRFDGETSIYILVSIIIIMSIRPQTR